MKIKYEFVTGAVEVEVTDDWGTILVDLDRQEYNINHKETRRHCSLDAYNLDDTLFPSDVDVLRDILRAEDAERLYSAIAKLEPRQQKLIRQVFFEGCGYTDIARTEGLDEKVFIKDRPNPALLWPTCERRKRYLPFGKEEVMRHNVKISVSKEPQSGGIVQCRNVSLREKLLTRLLGRREKVMILVPGSSVESVCITEVPEGGAACE